MLWSGRGSLREASGSAGPGPALRGPALRRTALRGPARHAWETVGPRPQRHQWSSTDDVHGASRSGRGRHARRRASAVPGPCRESGDAVAPVNPVPAIGPILRAGRPSSLRHDTLRSTVRPRSLAPSTPTVGGRRQVRTDRRPPRTRLGWCGDLRRVSTGAVDKCGVLWMRVALLCGRRGRARAVSAVGVRCRLAAVALRCSCSCVQRGISTGARTLLAVGSRAKECVARARTGDLERRPDSP